MKNIRKAVAARDNKINTTNVAVVNERQLDVDTKSCNVYNLPISSS